jgi:aryl-alcohol dehydrogenase-like predicted oxidoreductase
MKTRTIGSLDVSLAGLGCNNFGRVLDEKGADGVVGAAIDAGVTYFDTADLYGDGLSEEFLGKALGAQRKGVVVGTKFGMMAPPPGVRPASAEWTTRSCEGSLRRLRTDYIDLYILHQPDPATPIGETLGALAGLVKAGKVREIGGSNMSVEQIEEAASAAASLGVPGFASVQNECSLVHRDDLDTVVPLCERKQIAYQPFFPLGSGILTGKYRREEEPSPEHRLGRAAPERRSRFLSDANFDLAERLERFAAGHGLSLLDLSLSWLASLPAVATVFPGATTPDQVRLNARAVQAWEMSRDDLAEVRLLAAMS